MKTLKMTIVSVVCFQPSSYKRRSYRGLREGGEHTEAGDIRMVPVARESLNRTKEEN